MLGGRMRDDRGMATLLVCCCAMAMVALTLLALQVGTATVARHRAETAADMGALAGAAVVLNGARAACDAVAAVVTANGGMLDECTLHGADVLVVVSMDVTIGPLTRRADAHARAGPVAQQSP